MSKIITIDLVLFFLFCLLVSVFLYKNKKNLKREGIIFLYKTKLGINFIEKFAKENENFLKKIKYVIIFLSIILMIIVVLMLSINAYYYVKFPKQIKEVTNGAIPIAPVIPYFPKIFGLDNFFPNFYFIYFIIIFSLVALFHEFAHGIYMQLYKVRIKSTGFLFLGPILGAFVEQDDKQFIKKKNSEQMAVLGAGVFTNFLLSVIFFLLLVGFFYSFYNQSGYIIPNYAYTPIQTKDITEIYDENGSIITIKTEKENYLLFRDYYEKIKDNITKYEKIIVYLDAPAIRNNLTGAITEIDGKKIRNWEDFKNEISQKRPNEEIEIKTLEKNGKESSYRITLDKNPVNNSLGFLGIISPNIDPPKGFFRKVIYKLAFFKNPYTHYETKFDKEIVEFIYYFLWWCAMINFFVAIFNMLPFGIFDGGRFTYLLILSIIKKEKISARVYKIFSTFVVILFLSIILSWLFSKILL